MKNYLCEICGKKHDIFRGIRDPYPAQYHEIPDEEKDDRIQIIGNVMIIDDTNFFAHGNIYIEIENQVEPFFCWEVWVEILMSGIEQFVENYKPNSIMILDSILLSELPFYEKAKGLKVKPAIPTSSKEDSKIIIKIEEDSPLKEDQSKPITEKRMIELMQMIHHNPKREARQHFTQPFKERLLAELEHTESAYIAHEKDFVIDLSTSTVLFQIIKSTMLESTQSFVSGFGLHLAFDTTHEECVAEIARFRSKAYAKDFAYHDLDGVPTYQIDLGTDNKRIEMLVSTLVVDVYETDLESVEVDSYEV